MLEGAILLEVRFEKRHRAEAMEWELAGDKAQQMEAPRDKKETHFTCRHGSSWAAGQGPESELCVRKTLGVATGWTREDALVAATAQGGPPASPSTPRAHNPSLSQSPACPPPQESPSLLCCQQLPMECVQAPPLPHTALRCRAALLGSRSPCYLKSPTSGKVFRAYFLVHVEKTFLKFELQILSFFS